MGHYTHRPSSPHITAKYSNEAQTEKSEALDKQIQAIIISPSPLERQLIYKKGRIKPEGDVSYLIMTSAVRIPSFHPRSSQSHHSLCHLLQLRRQRACGVLPHPSPRILD